MTTTITVRALNTAEVAYLRDKLATDLAHAEHRRDETEGPERLYWTSRADAIEGALDALDGLCGMEPWAE